MDDESVFRRNDLLQEHRHLEGAVGNATRTAAQPRNGLREQLVMREFVGN